MAKIDSEQKLLSQPSIEEVAEAKRYPGGWIYRIAGHYSPEDSVPPEAIVGAWQVNELGVITGAFHSNPRYDATKFPAIRKEK